jgi:uncharacterized protein YfaS (alpha-2-macroglobulin family)
VSYSKELLAASLVALGLAAGLGTISFALPSAMKVRTVLDIYTPNSGIGIDSPGGTFEPNDNVSIIAYLAQGGIPVKDKEVTLSIRNPDGTEKVNVAHTNDSGFIQTLLSFLPSETNLIGSWQISARCIVDDEAAEDALTLHCKSEDVHLDVFSKKNGAASNSFLPLDNVFLGARLSYKNAPIAGAPVAFEIKTPNDTELFPLPQTVTTDSRGEANVTFSIPMPSNFTLGTWTVIATSEHFEQVVNVTTNFDSTLLSPVIDVYTQKEGQGPNRFGGIFVDNETVYLFAEFRDQLNQTLSNRLVSFEVRKEDGSIHYAREQSTDISGIANITQSLYPDPSNAGVYLAYVSIEYYGAILLDTLTFTIQ